METAHTNKKQTQTGSDRNINAKLSTHHQIKQKSMFITTIEPHTHTDNNPNTQQTNLPPATLNQ
ncbi:hypothetical protein HOLleu_01036 [Holothuria leucospilota]|uniref:Uncharacterized protein n=1 Tax=Holothuria leucospilota TaxID=206669 RepID=A0A9Q1HKP8_HOLLE|nr:hypothetical protein HOLleu_01036 [Holothuria leucospilota]